MLFFLDLRDKNQGGAVLPGRIVIPPAPLGDSNATLDLLAIHPHVVFLLHGFNVDRAGGQQQLKDFAAGLQLGANTAFVAVTWPGDSWAGPASYPLEGNDADDSALELARFISWAIPDGTKLSFISHSLGARVVFETIKALPKGVYPVAQVCVMAAAIDDFSVSEQHTYRAQTEGATRVAVLASERDNTLRWAYPLGDLLQSFIFFWKDVSGSALGYHGPVAAADAAVPANVQHVQIPTTEGVDHGDYLFIGPPSPLEARAVAFANQAMNGVAPLQY